MKTYAYFPGCSLETMAESYHLSALETTRALGVELKEMEDWNCCGATAYFHVDELLAHTLCARNLAIAEKENLEIVAPCSGCYKNLYFTNVQLKEDQDLADHINYALEADDLHYSGTVGVRHLLDVFVKDVGIEEVHKRVVHPLKGLRVAPYYGCQLLRPRKEKDENVEQPEFFEDLMAALGAVPVPFSHKLCCCGGSLIVTNRIAALSMLRNLLQSATEEGAHVIATICPLCQINLECYQKHVNREFHTNYALPIYYFTQLMGVAFGIPPKRLGLGKEFISLQALATKETEKEATLTEAR